MSIRCFCHQSTQIIKAFGTPHSRAASITQLSWAMGNNTTISSAQTCSATPSAIDARMLHSSRCTQIHEMSTGLAGALASNQFASGGLALMAVGLFAAGAKTALDWVLELAKRRLFVRMEIDSRDDAYRWVMAWLSHHPQFKDSPRISATTSLQAFGTSGLEGSLVGSKKVLLLPAPGDHVLKHGGRWLWVSRQRAATSATNFNTRTLPETLVVSAWGRDRKVLEDMLAECAAAYEADTRQRTVVHSMDADGYWVRAGSRPIRPLNTVVLPGKQAEQLLADCQEFLASEPWYAHHDLMMLDIRIGVLSAGIPYRRGYLLYGIPGSGKTSLVTALAGALALDVYVASLSSPSLTDEMLRILLNNASDRCVLLLEDVDAAFVDRQSQEGKTNSLTFSGLLNAIDGVAAQEGRLLFLTTNHIEKLSPALIRPGRVDVRLYFGYATRDQIRQLFISFYQHLPPAGADTYQPASSLQQATTASSGHLVKDYGQLQPDTRMDVVKKPEEGNAQSGQVMRFAGSVSQTKAEAGMKLKGEKVVGTGIDKIDDLVNDFKKVSVGASHASAVVPDVDLLAIRFADRIPEQHVSMATLQGYLMRHKCNPYQALACVDAWVQTLPTPDKEQQERQLSDVLA